MDTRFNGTTVETNGVRSIAGGGTGASTAEQARINLGITGGGVTSYNDLTDLPTLGTAAATASTDYATASHAHGSITNAGAIGTTASLPVITGDAGVLQAGAFGTTAGTFCQGNDSRFSGIQPNPQSTAYTLQLSDAGKYINISTGSVTVPSGVFASGDVISVYNNSASNLTITQGTGVTIYLAGTSTTGNRTLAQRGLVTILCVGSNTFTIIGGGLT